MINNRYSIWSKSHNLKIKYIKYIFYCNPFTCYISNVINAKKPPWPECQTDLISMVLNRVLEYICLKHPGHDAAWSIDTSRSSSISLIFASFLWQTRRQLICCSK